MSYRRHDMDLALVLDRQRAALAKHMVERDSSTDVDLIADVSALTRKRVPLRLTMARVGALIGATALAAMFTAGFVGMIGLEFGAFETLLLDSPVISVLTLALLAALLGALAGALSFSTETRTKLHRLRTVLGRTPAPT